MVIIPKPEPAVKSAAPAPKRPRGRPRKDGSSNSGGRPGGSESSSDELEIEDEEPPETTPALLSISVPTDERGKTVYHAVQAVWSPRNKSVDPEKVRSGIASYGETIRGLRDAWKTKNEILRKAELPNSPTAADAPKLKDEVARYRELLDIVMLRSTQYGHPAIVKRYVYSSLSTLTSDFSPVYHHVLWKTAACGQKALIEVNFSIFLSWLQPRTSLRSENEAIGPRCMALSPNVDVHSSTPLNSLQIAVLVNRLRAVGRPQHCFPTNRLITFTDDVAQTRRKSVYHVGTVLVHA